MMLRKLKESVKLFVSNKHIRRSRRIMGRYWHRMMSSTYLLSIPASMLNPLTFMREQRAVRRGKGNYYKGLTKLESRSLVRLRRNTHQVEKGLIMRPRRKVFGRDYIGEMVESYRLVVEKVKKGKLHDIPELEWAHNTLTEYFSVVEPVGVIGEAKEVFESVDYKPKNLNSKPYHRVQPKNLPTYEQLLTLSEYRRSVRWFEKKKVPREIIDKALLVARQSPTACNRLPYEFRIYDDPELVKQVANTPFGTTGFSDNIHTIAVVVGKLDSFFSARDRHSIYTDASLAIMGFIYALEVQGVSSCTINWPDFEPLERKMQKLLSLGIDDRPIMLIAIGYEDKTAKVPRSVKKDLDTFRSYNKI